MIVTKNLIKTFSLGGDTIRALDGVDLHVKEGELLAITGSSGSGKSTLMNILGCLDWPDSGSYSLGGEDVSKLTANRLAEIRSMRIGFIFQSFNLLPRMSALENVELPMLYSGKQSKSRERATTALKRVGLGERMYHEPNQLSGGQRQRVAIARALVNNPAIILADEPTGNLDSKTGVEILKLIKDLNAEGSTIVIVTHDPKVARECQREVYMKDGRVTEGSAFTVAA